MKRVFSAVFSVIVAVSVVMIGAVPTSADGLPEVVMVKDIYPSGSSNPQYLTDVDGTLFFSAYNNSNGRELWKSDGSGAGTVMVKDIYSGSSSSDPMYLVNMGGMLFFSAYTSSSGRELWKGDGTGAGTVMVKDIHRGPSNSYPQYLTDVGGTVFFNANNGSSGRELWKSDGTGAGTVMVKDIYPGSSDSNPYYLTDVGGTLFFVADDGTNGPALWKSDGTGAGTVMVKKFSPAIPEYLIDVGGTLFFRRWYGGSSPQLWKSDGTEAGTVMVKNFSASIEYLTDVGDTLFFAGYYSSTFGTELWKSDGTAAGTVMVKDIRTGSSSSYPYRLTCVDGTLFFSAYTSSSGRELWKSDGTEAGTVMVKDIYPGTGNSAPEYLTDVDGTLIFRANDGSNGYKLWKSDGTEGGTSMSKDDYPGPDYLNLYHPTGVGGTFFFNANNGTNGYELWKASLNQPPLANAGPDQTLEQSSLEGAEVTLDGSGSTDPDGDPLTYTWTWDTSTEGGVSPTIVLPLGTTAVTLVVNDGTVDSDPDTVDITVQDTTAPVITLVGDDPQTVECGDSYIELGATASDICCGDITDSIVINTTNVDATTVGTYTVTYDVTDCNGNPASQINRTVNVVDTTAPEVNIEIPAEYDTIQDGVTITATASDFCGVAEAYFYVREANGGDGTPVGFEDLPANLNATSGKWEYAFDSTQLPDGYYVVLAKAVDDSANEGWSDIVPFSIRNWAVIELLPATENNKAGRTMPVKFSLRIAQAVDPEQPFVYNEDLEIRIYDAAHPETVLQSSLFGNTSTDYRIDLAGDKYITNFKTAKTPATYVVEIWRPAKDFLVGSFSFSTVK